MVHSASFAPRQPVRAYLSAAQLSELTPWTVDAIEKMVKRGVLRRGVHWFQIERRARLIFKWDAIVELIEGRPPTAGEAPVDSRPATEAEGTMKVFDVTEATKELRRLLD